MAVKGLYHGSLTLFDRIDVNKGKGYKDFGKGFYTSTVKSHSERLALRNKRFYDNKLKGSNLERSTAYLYELEYDDSILKTYNTKVFNVANEEWVSFILTNRINAHTYHNYDIVIGPTADDNTLLTLNDFRRGAFGDPETARARQILLELLEPQNLPKQVFFGTDRVVNELRIRSVVKL